VGRKVRYQIETIDKINKMTILSDAVFGIMTVRMDVFDTGP